MKQCIYKLDCFAHARNDEQGIVFHEFHEFIDDMFFYFLLSIKLTLLIAPN